MGVLHGNPFLLASGTATEPAVPLQRSVRLRSSNSAYLNRTTGSAGNRTTITYSAWVKRGLLGGDRAILSSTSNGGAGYEVTILRFTSTDALRFSHTNNAGGAVIQFDTTAVFRDPSAWYHIVLQIDTTQATNNNGIKLYVNGVLQAGTFAAYTQNAQIWWTAASRGIQIGYTDSVTAYFDGYLTEVYFIDGLALTPSSFGGYNAGTNVWEVRKYSGTYGTNGFYLPFTNPASIGADGSGNGNNWTPNGIQISNSALTTYDSMLDVPTNTGSNNSNFATLNPLASNTTLTPTQGNLYLGNQATNNFSCVATMGVSSGKWYWEVKPDSSFVMVGITPLSSVPVNTWPGQPGPQALGYYSNNGQKYNNGTGSAYGATWTSADLIGIALDMDAGTLTFYKNGTSQGVAFSSLTGTYFPILGGPNAYNSGHINFGQRPFEQTPPSGHKSLNTYNLPEPTIPRGDKYFKQYLYTGNGGGLQIGEIQKPASLFNLDRSVRLRSSASARFTRTPAVAGNRKTWTWSAWVKRGLLASDYGLFNSAGATNTDYLYIKFDGSDRLYVGNFSTNFVTTSAVYRDPSAWYHLVVTLDTTQATATDRLKVYVNGIQVTSFNTDNRAAQIAINSDQGINRVATHIIGNTGAVHYFDGYISDMYLIDGQALTPTSFGAFDGNNYWTPKAYTGTYGTNGFHLEFEDYSNNTATTIGKDTSGNGNNWTPTGIVVSPTTSASNDSMVDVPTQTNESVANFATINPLNIAGTALTISAANLNFLQGSSLYGHSVCTLPIRSKTYFEVTIGSPVGAGRNMYAGVGSSNVASAYSTANYFGTDVTAWSLAYSNVTAYISNNGVATAQSGTVAGGDIFMYAVDPANGKIWFGRNGTWYSGDPSAGTGASYSNLPAEVFPVVQAYNSGTHSINFGQRPFTHTPPTGFKSLNSFNVAEVTGDVETPDLVRIKSRSATTAALWFNSVSGVGKHIVGNNSTAGEVTDPNSIIQFNKNGLLIGNNANINTSAATYIADVWKAGDTVVTNTAGSISSQVRANPISGVSIVSWVGNNSAATIGHGLGVAPSMIIWKYRTATSDWAVGHKMLNNGSSPWSYWLQLQTTARDVASAGPFNNTAPTSSVFSVGSFNNLNTMVAFCFAEIPGFSKMDRYVSNGSSTDGPFVYTGFRPRFVMIKQADAIRSWIMYDTTRNPTNVTDKYFFMEGLNNNEQTAALLDITSNGFKLKNNNVNTNTTAGSNYIYMAFAENPFKYALAR